MNITPAQLTAEYERASRDWPFITTFETAYHLPRMMLYAVGSRETNLTNEVGDGGHGNGVFQLDDRSHVIPAGFNQNVPLQAKTAAYMLHDLLMQFNGNVRAAMAAYNAGAGTVEFNLAHNLPIDTGTANGNYSSDTFARMMYLQQTFPVFSPPKDNDMWIVQFPNAKNSTSVYTFNGRCLFHLSPEDFSSKGLTQKDITVIIHHNVSAIYHAPIAPGQTDPRV